MHQFDPPSQNITDTRKRFIQRIAALPIKPAASDFYVRWAESWVKARGHQSPERNLAYFEALGRSSHLADWQFRQAVDAARILACDVLDLSWSNSFDWQGLSDQAHSLEANHRTVARESIPVYVPIAPPSDPGHLPAVDEEIARIVEALRRSIRLVGHAYATEETYVHWATRFARFCFAQLKQTPQMAVPAGITAYLNYLVLERNVAPLSS